LTGGIRRFYGSGYTFGPRAADTHRTRMSASSGVRRQELTDRLGTPGGSGVLSGPDRGRMVR